MVDYRKLLDAFVGAIGRADVPYHGQGDENRAMGKGGAPGIGQQIQQSVNELKNQSPEQLLQKAKDLAAQHPGLTQAALLGLAGLVFGKRKKGKLTGNLVRLGGLAVIGGLAYRAYQSHQSGAKNLGAQAPSPSLPGDAAKEPTEAAGAESAVAEGALAENTLAMPEASRFHPVSQTEDDALLFLRTMVAAAAADGHIDETERSRITKGLSEAGIDQQATRWLDTEMASPADVEELAASVNDPDKAAQVYAAARIAIDPDTIQEREFLNQLAEALDLDAAMRAEIDDAVGSLT